MKVVKEARRKTWKGGYQFLEEEPGPKKKMRRTFSGSVSGGGNKR